MSIEEKIETIAKNVPEVYEAGKQAEYDRFWDEYQENGNSVKANAFFKGRLEINKEYFLFDNFSNLFFLKKL